MSNKKRKPAQRRSASTYRAPTKHEPEVRRGFLDRFAPRPPGTTPMPRIRTSFTRGLSAVLATPALVVAIPVVVLLEWVVLVALGFQGPFTLLASTFGLPPISTSMDITLASNVFSPVGKTGGATTAIVPFVAIGVFLVVSAALQAVVTTVAVERFRTGSVTSWAVHRALHVWPVTIAVGVANLGVLIAAQFGQLLGAGIGLLIALAILMAGVYLLAFAPAIAADEDHRIPFTLSKAVRAARMPGSNNLLLAALYVVPSIAILSATSLGALPGSTIDVNPSIGAWVTVILLNLLQASVVATFAFRYLSVADVVPDAPAPRALR
jgi:hypothetical protein